MAIPIIIFTFFCLVLPVIFTWRLIRWVRRDEHKFRRRRIVLLNFSVFFIYSTVFFYLAFSCPYFDAPFFSSDCVNTNTVYGFSYIFFWFIIAFLHMLFLWLGIEEQQATDN
ncbi:MAG TPA: hypothetical protein VL651_04835 [Bacteroidia bacterium]|nr:hypothetical protein [Bacteroidia bacterium]